MGECCDVDTGTYVLGGKVPKLFDSLIDNKKAIKYAGSPNMFVPFKIVTGNDYMYINHSPLSSKAPVAYFDNNKNVWVLNPPTDDMSLLSIVVIPENPKDLVEFSCCAATDDDPYPIPGWMADTITGKLVNDYIRYFNSGQIQSTNTMSAQDVNVTMRND